jgi:hypothetical protein
MGNIISILRVLGVKNVTYWPDYASQPVSQEFFVQVELRGQPEWLTVGVYPDAGFPGNPKPAEHPYAVGDFVLVEYPEVPAVVLRKLTKDNVGESWTR